MAELASGAVSSLLGVIRNEWVLLGRVGSDVQFIKEEMESMNSFLMHLTRTVPPGGEHDEQVRTWMNQVRLLAQDCNNCIDLYLYRGNRDIHLGKDCLGRYLRWVPWFVQKMVAQHRAASELGELKERASDVGNRRLRYGVEVPKNAAPGAAAGEGGEAIVNLDGEEDGDEQVGSTATHGSDRIRTTLFGLNVLEDHFNDKLTDWIEEVQLQWRQRQHQQQHDTRCVAVVVPSTEDCSAIAREASVVAEKHVKNTVLVDIPALHIWPALGPKNILYYILREIELQKLAKSQSQQQQQGQGTGQGEESEWQRKRRIRKEKKRVIRAIKEDINTMKVAEKIQEINSHIEKVKGEQLQSYLKSEKKKNNNVKDKISKEHLRVLLVLLRSAAAADVDEETKNAMPTLAECYETLIKKTAEKLKCHMEQVNKEAGEQQRILLSVTQYEHILREVFPKIRSDSNRQQVQEQDTKQGTREATPGKEAKDQIKEIIDKVKQEILSDVLVAISDNTGQQATKTNSTTTLNEDQVKKMTHEAKLEILQELKEDKSDKKQATGAPGGQGPTAEGLAEESKKGQLATGSNPAQGQNQEAITETIKKMKYTIKSKIKRQLHINGIVEKIQNHLKHEEKTLIILKVDQKYVDQWEQTRIALSLLPCVAVVMILTKTENIQEREYCYPPGEPIDYSSLAALYHDIVLEITSQQKNEDNYGPQILRTILDMCERNEFCMKIFAHTLYAKPKINKEELDKLHHTLQMLPQKSFRSIAMKMFKFSYRDMPKEYQSCLLYLAIFPRGHKIRRSTLIGRWVTEGLITTEDWRWSSSVHKAEQCFDTLITKWLVYAAEISATGRVKSCTVGDQVHEFITEIAKKQRIVETRLSHHLARHFSIFNDIHLRGSDKIDSFLKRLSESSQWSRLKGLDLEGCRCFKKNPRYLKNICKNILLLKYLSLRGTDVTHLPSEINNLRELEVLDIQQTEVPESETKNLLLLKLKRLLAGHTDPTPRISTSTGTYFPSHVLVPEKIEKMLDMEVLSNVKARSIHDLKDIGKLWQLRKLGVVIEYKDTHINKLLQAISNLHECLRSLSITLNVSKSKGTLSMDSAQLEHPPKVLERLSISGDIKEQILPLLLDMVNTTLIKLTLSNISLSQINLEDLSKLPMLRCLRLRHNTFTDNKLTFKGEFKKLMYFLVEGSNRIEISFEGTTAPELEKFVLSLDNIESIAGVDHLPKLEELELNNNNKNINSSRDVTAAPASDLASSTTAGPAPFTAAAAHGLDPATAATNPDPFAVAATDHTPSTPAATTTTNPLPSNPTAAAAATTTNTVANDPVPSTATGTDPAPSVPTAATNPASFIVAATDHALSTPTATATTNPSPSAPTAVAASTTAVAIANDPVPSTATVTARAPFAVAATDHAPSTPAIIATTNPSASSPTIAAAAATAVAVAHDPIATAIDPAPSVPAAATNPAPFVIAATDHALSTSAATATINPSPSAPTAAAVTNDPVPSVPIATADATDPPPSAPTVAAVANDPVPSVPIATADATDPPPSAPTVAAVANDPVPCVPTATADATYPSPSAPNTSNTNTVFSKLLSDAKQIAKVTLRGTMLKQGDLQLLARMANIRWLALLDKSCDESQLALSKDEFPKLNILIVNCSTITSIKFNSGSSPKLEKIVWTFAKMMNFSGIENLPRLKELEFKGDSPPDQVQEIINKHKDRIYYAHYKPESQDQTVENTEDEDDVPSCPFKWKDKGWRRRN